MSNKNIKEVTIYFLLVLGLSFFVFWGPIALLKIPTVNLVQNEMGPVWAVALFIIGGFVPSATGILLTARYEGKEGVRSLLKESIRARVGHKVYITIMIVVIYFAFAMMLISAIAKGQFDYPQFWLQLPTILPLILLGPLSEEYGWRGFALKRLLRSTSANMASLIIGVIWALWHLPLFYMLGTSQYELGIPFIAFLLSVTGTSFIYTYLYIRAKSSIFPAIVLHWLYSYVMQVASSSITRSDLYNWIEYIPAVLIGILFAILMRRDKSYPLN